MKKRILHILNSSSYSGAENVVITIINNMSDEYECAYASMDGSIKDVLENNNIKFIPIKKTTVSEVRRIVHLFNPDIIHAHDYTTSIICAFSFLKTPVISHLHNNSPWIKTYHPFSFIYLLSCIKYEKILSVSSSVFEEYVFGKLISKKSTVVSNPIDISIIQKKAFIENGEIVPEYDIVFIGRLSAPKNLPRFIKIVKELVNHIPEIKVCIIGDGELKDECDKQIQELELEENIILKGFLENPYKILSKSKVLCMTSEWEGFGLVAVEALTLGVPVVATPVGGLPNIVDNLCGFLTDDNNEYVGEIKKLLEYKEYREMKSQSAKKKSNILSNISSYIDNLYQLYEL